MLRRTTYLEMDDKGDMRRVSVVRQVPTDPSPVAVAGSSQIKCYSFVKAQRSLFASLNKLIRLHDYTFVQISAGARGLAGPSVLI